MGVKVLGVDREYREADSSLEAGSNIILSRVLLSIESIIPKDVEVLRH